MVKAFSLLAHYNFPQYIFFNFCFCFLHLWSLYNLFCSGPLKHCCSVLITSRISYGVLPLQFNEFLEFNPLSKTTLVLRSLILLTSNPFFVLVEVSASSNYFTEHTSPTSCFFCGSSKNRITSSKDGAHHAISWNII